MRVLFTTWTIAGHFAPLVPIGWALRAAGHEVLVACPPGDTDQVVRAGLPALPVGPDVNMVGLLRAKRGRGRQPRTVEDMFNDPNGYGRMVHTAEAVADVLADDLVEYCRRWQPDLVIYEPTSLVGPLVARLLGIPAVRQLWTSDFTAPINGFPATITGDLVSRFGLSELGTAGDLTLDTCPPILQVVDDLPRQPMRYVPYNGPARLPEWLREPPKRKRICVSWGTTLHTLGRHRMFHVPRVVSALASVDAEVVVAVMDTHRELFPDPPPNVRAVGPVPLHLLLPTCDAIVHQGGSGTLMTAMASGVPQVIVPTLPDHNFNARYMVAAGAGVQVPGREDVTEEDVLASTVDVLSDPAFRAAAARLREENQARPAPAEVVPALERLARDYALAGVTR